MNCSIPGLPTLCDPMNCSIQASLSITNARSLPKLMSIDLVMPSNHFILCHPFLFPPSIFPSIRFFSNVSVFHVRRPKYWSFTFSISPSNEYSGISIEWFDLAIHGTLKSPPAPQFKGISSLVLSFLYGPTLTSIYEYWKKHSFDSTDLCQQGDFSAV